MATIAPKLPLIVLALAAACGGDGLLLPNAGQPARITILRGDGQIDTVGQQLQEPFVVKVTDLEGRGVDSVEVTFIPPAGAVLEPNDTVFTGPNGEAAVRYTLALTAGDQAIRASAKPVVATPELDTVFHAMAEPEAATSLVLASGNGQVGEAGTILTDSLAVRAVDRFDNGVAGIEVIWEAEGGSVSPATVVTGAEGRAAVERTLGNRAGSYPTTAAAAQLEGSLVEFTATAVPPPSPRLVVVTQPSGRASAGVPFSRQPVLQLQTAAGAPLSRGDVIVTVQIASGGGSLGGATTSRSNADGEVRFTDLSIGGTPGERTLIFAASDFTSAQSADIDVGAGPPLPGASSASVPANGTVGVATQITVRLQDAFGTPVEDAAGDIAITVAGSNLVSGMEVTDAGDGSYTASYTPTVGGADQVDVRVNGEPVLGSPFTSVIAAGAASPATTTATLTRGGLFNLTVDVVVTTRDAQGNVLGRGGDQVLAQLNGGGFQPLTDQGNGTYTVSYSPVFAIVIDILLNGVPISGSPFTTTTP